MQTLRKNSTKVFTKLFRREFLLNKEKKIIQGFSNIFLVFMCINEPKPHSHVAFIAALLEFFLHSLYYTIPSPILSRTFQPLET